MKNINKFIENVLFQGAAISRGFFHCCAICALTFSAGAQETDNYYWRGGTWGQSAELLRIDLAGNWAADSSGETVHEISPSETSNLIFDYANIADRQHARINVYYRTVAVNSVASYVPTEMHMQSGYSLTVLSDWTSSVSSDTRYSASYRTDDNGDKKSVRFAADTANFLTVGGDMTLSTDKYFTSRIRLGSQQGSSAYTLTIGGALSFVKNGVDAVGYHVFDMIAFDSTTGTAFAPVPGFKPVTAMTVIAGVAFGAEAGFMTGSMSALISNIYFGQGPWTPFQMAAWGFIGLLAGLLFSRRRNPPMMLLLIYGAFAGVAFSLIMDIWTTFSAEGGFSSARYLFYVGTALPVTAVYAVSNVVFLAILSKPLLRKLERIKIKYGVFE